jgi:AraC family transcriptional regulator
MRYVLRTRVERAKMLLRNSGSTVSEIALELGFADQSHLTRTFRHFVGVPPGVYARHHRAARSA